MSLVSVDVSTNPPTASPRSVATSDPCLGAGRWVYRRVFGIGLVLVLAYLASTTAGAAATHRVNLGGGEVASYVAETGGVYLETSPRRGEGLLAFARRLTGDASASDVIAGANGDSRSLRAGVRYKIPVVLLRDELRARTLRGLFAGDERQPDGWVHVIAATMPGQSLWNVALWFTDDGENFRRLREHNRLADDTLEPGQRLFIPRALLVPVLAAALPALAPPMPAFGLTYETDARGEFAVYRLAAGEALYSSVVVRFTGRTFADDVNALAAEIAKLNRIPDVTDMAIGQSVRIPVDLLMPEFLPLGHPRRAEYERGLAESSQYSNTIRASRLEGITVVLDAGHGGMDPGTIYDGVWESTYAYDITLRVRALLQATTSAEVAVTTRDGERFRIVDKDRLPGSRGHRVLTTPPYAIADTTPGIHFRWYLANSLYRRAVKRNGDAEKVVFLSVHADALHPTLRGAMIYVPASSLTRGTFGKQGALYSKRQEYRERPKVTYSWKERTRSEGLSRQLAEKLMGSFRRNDLAVHHEKPIRDRIIRSRRSTPFVPAVVRYNAVPAKLLIEVCNLSNNEDRRLLQTRAFRQHMADAIVEGILDYYGQAPHDPRAVAP